MKLTEKQKQKLEEIRKKFIEWNEGYSEENEEVKYINYLWKNFVKKGIYPIFRKNKSKNKTIFLDDKKKTYFVFTFFEINREGTSFEGNYNRVPPIRFSYDRREKHLNFEISCVTEKIEFLEKFQNTLIKIKGFEDIKIFKHGRENKNHEIKKYIIPIKKSEIKKYFKLFNSSNEVFHTIGYETFVKNCEKYIKTFNSSNNQKTNKEIEKTKKEETKFENQISNLLNKKNQIILYGPAGTGKTYSTKQIIELHSKENYENLKNEGRVEFTTFHQSFAYEEFIEGIKPDLENEEEIKYKLQDGIFKNICEKAEDNYRKSKVKEVYNKLKNKNLNEIKTIKESLKPYYLIIDEINRGNISKIFGELITLLEKSKRLGEDDEIIATLPYSNKEFGIPPNLFIIGTMNTSDKSIANLDIALRRRFGFIEMLPKYSLIKGEDPILEKFTIKEIFEKINDNILFEIDKDHLIGHSYFMDIKDIDDFKFTMFYEIIPLLEEYCYNDFEKIQNILKINKNIDFFDMFYEKKSKDNEEEIYLNINFDDVKIKAKEENKNKEDE